MKFSDILRKQTEFKIALQAYNKTGTKDEVTAITRIYRDQPFIELAFPEVANVGERTTLITFNEAKELLKYFESIKDKLES